jgi:protein phosphatase methylesterase 1
MLAGTDRLDKELTIGQMQGKFQLVVLPTGHTIQEDDPKKTAAALIQFLKRHKLIV